MTDPAAQSSRALNRVLLREAGEHLGTLAEQAREAYLLHPKDVRGWREKWDRHVELTRLSREVLEIANA